MDMVVNHFVAIRGGHFFVLLSSAAQTSANAFVSSWRGNYSATVSSNGATKLRIKNFGFQDVSQDSTEF